MKVRSAFMSTPYHALPAWTASVFFNNGTSSANSGSASASSICSGLIFAGISTVSRSSASSFALVTFGLMMPRFLRSAWVWGDISFQRSRKYSRFALVPRPNLKYCPNSARTCASVASPAVTRLFQSRICSSTSSLSSVPCPSRNTAISSVPFWVWRPSRIASAASSVRLDTSR